MQMRPYPDFPEKFLKFTIIDILRRNKNALWLKVCIKLRGREKFVSLVVFVGSLLRAELKCRETLLVLKLEGWQRALTIARRQKSRLTKHRRNLRAQITLGWPRVPTCALRVKCITEQGLW